MPIRLKIHTLISHFVFIHLNILLQDYFSNKKKKKTDKIKMKHIQIIFLCFTMYSVAVCK